MPGLIAPVTAGPAKPRPATNDSALAKALAECAQLRSLLTSALHELETIRALLRH
jgi:hypothetical protein